MKKLFCLVILSAILVTALTSCGLTDEIYKNMVRMSMENTEHQLKLTREVLEEEQSNHDEETSLLEQILGRFGVSNTFVEIKNADTELQNTYLVESLSPYASNDFTPIDHGNVMMLGGNEYGHGFQLDVYGWNGQSCAIYNIDGEYDQLTGITGYVDGNTGDGENWIVWIYGDDELLFQCDVKLGDLPQKFMVNVSGVKKLEFRTGETNGCRGLIGFADIRITK